jgi:hypothetical protein
MFPVRVAAPHGSVHERATPRSGGGVTAAHSTACGGSAPRHRLCCPARVSLAVPPGTCSAAWPHPPLEMPSTPRDAVPCLLPRQAPVHPLRAYQSLSYTRLLLWPQHQQVLWMARAQHHFSVGYGWRFLVMTARTKGRQPREVPLFA